MSTSNSTLPRFQSSSEFAKELRAQSKIWLGKEIPSPKADVWHWARGGAMIVVGTFAYINWILGSTGILGTFLCLTIMGICCFGMLMVFGHDASHGSLSRHKWVNDVALFVAFAVNGFSGEMWKDRHIRLHHTRPNVPGTEIDAYSSNIVRMSPLQPYHFFHRFQILYAPVVLLLGILSLVWIQDFVFLKKMRKRTNNQKPNLLLFTLTKAIHAALFLGIPIWVAGHSPEVVLAGYVYVTIVVSAIFWLLVIGTHVSDLAEFPKPDNSHQLDEDWATLQVKTTVDWSPTSRIAAWCTGGSNAHLAHHLFPNVSHSHSAKLSGHLSELAQKHGLHHNVVPFHQMFLGSIRLIYKLGISPEKLK